jgi:hypothetical protein
MPRKELTMHRKAELYDKVMAIMKDRITLETYMRSVGKSADTVTGIRADAYGMMVNLLVGHRVLPDLPISKESNGYECAPLHGR